MPEPLFDMRVNSNVAYHNDGTHEYFGKSARGTATSESKWQIAKMVYDNGYNVAGDPWILKWPNGDDSPLYEWDEVESYEYLLLKSR